MPIDLMIPVGILAIMVFYFLFTRARYEKEVVSIYEEKFEQWKEHSSLDEKVPQKECKELVGLVFKTGYNIDIELFDEDLNDRISRGKFNIKEK